VEPTSVASHQRSVRLPQRGLATATGPNGAPTAAGAVSTSHRRYLQNDVVELAENHHERHVVRGTRVSSIWRWRLRDAGDQAPPLSPRLVLRAVLGPSHSTGPARLASLGRAVALIDRRLGCTTPIDGMRSTKRRPRHRAIAARRSVALERCAGPHPLADTRRLTDRWHHCHSHGGRAVCRRPPRLLTPIVPAAVPAVRTHVVRLRAAHLSRGLSRPVVPPSVPAAGRALAEVLAIGHTVHGAQRRQRLGRHEVWLRRGRCRLVLPSRSPVRRHQLDTRSWCRRPPTHLTTRPNDGRSRGRIDTERPVRASHRRSFREFDVECLGR
jgi:hypothetical protein